MKKYDIEVEEVLRRVVHIEANNIAEAVDKVEEQYKNEEIVLDSSDYCETHFNNLYSKKLDKSMNIYMKYDSNDGILTIIQDDNKEGKYICDTVEDIKSCLRTYLADYVENLEIEAAREVEDIEYER